MQQPRRGHVLVVDDDPGILRSVAWLLDAEGWEVHCAHNAMDTLHLLARLDVPLTLLLCDIQLPGLLGPRLAPIVQQHHPKVRVLYMSGDDRRYAVSRTAPVLYKPFDASDLIAAIEHILGEAFPAVASET
jgi:DNA-binding NtrC family response regulator